MTVKKRNVFLTVMTLMLCLTLIAGGTYALFTDRTELKTHLVAGTLEVDLVRTKLSATYLDGTTGYLTGPSVLHDEEVSFKEATTLGILDIPADPTDPNAQPITSSVMAPGCSYTVDMEIRGTADNSVAFGYWIQIDYQGTANAFAKQVMVTITPEGGTPITKVASDLSETLGSEDDLFGPVAKNGVAKFTLTITFCDDSTFDSDSTTANDDLTNNDAKTQEFEFDIVVHAVQATEAPRT